MNKIVKSAIVGLAVADAVGVPAEFIPREKLAKRPITDMVGFGSHDVPKGTWSDDTSMTLCTLNGIAQKGEIDLVDNILEFSKWVEDGYMTPHGKVFDIGRTCLRALGNYWRGKDVYSCGETREYANGNGSLMRILPVCLFNEIKHLSTEDSIKNIHAVSSLTHAHERSLIACGIYDFIVRELIEKPDKSSVKQALTKAKKFYCNYEQFFHYNRIFKKGFENLDVSEIKSSGYVVDTLEAAIWCLLNSTNYSECVLKAVNLGQDTDTVAAVAGGLAGIFYGYENIPQEWINALVKKDMISKLCDEFIDSILMVKAGG